MGDITGPCVEQLIDFLIKRGLDPNTPREPDGDMPLHVAGLACNAQVVRQLLKCGAQPNVKEASGNTVRKLPTTLFASLVRLCCVKNCRLDVCVLSGIAVVVALIRPFT